MALRAAKDIGCDVPADAIDGGYRSLLVAGCTLVLWLAATFVTRPEPRFHLLAFYTKVRPDGPGWGPIAAEAPTTRPDGTGVGLATVKRIVEALSGAIRVEPREGGSGTTFVIELPVTT